ncbi:MAG: carboxypeptidase-like regulatory domain-containing protein, partial [Bacteroidaceae bacterium]|nr:carboxypeptidase-like regulatory domain-containing protein [Bacteroidaceae bacterium]
MTKRSILFILTLFFLIPAYAQYLTGKVIAEDDGMPLVGATVWFKENPAAKVRVGEDGQYRIRFRQGTLVFHCFGFKNYEVEVTKNKPINISMKPSSLEMTEVVVKAERKKYSRKNNPAVELIQKVIAAKKTRDLRANDYASYKKYMRTMLALNDFSAQTLEQDENLKGKSFLLNYAEVFPETGKTIVPISIEEKNTTQLYRKSDDKSKSVVHGYHAESLLDVVAAGEFFETKFKNNLKDVDIYKDEIVLLEHNFISPIGGNAAIRQYHYALGDTVNLDGEKCIKVAFSPSNPQDFGFSGYLYILADSTYRVRRAKFGVPVASGINFVEKMDIDQEYVSLSTGEQICSKNRMIMQLKLTSYLSRILVDYNVTYSDWSFDPIPDEDIEFMGDEKFEKGAKARSNDYWAENRPDTLSYA